MGGLTATWSTAVDDLVPPRRSPPSRRRTTVAA